MPASAFPAVVDALVDLATAALPDVFVSDGEAVTGDPGDFLMIGSNNADAEGVVAAGESTQEWANAGGTTRDEEGDVSCLAISWNGDGDAKAARDTAYAIVDALADAVRADPSLGVPALLWSSFGARITTTQGQSEAGAACAVEFTVHYRARL